jgi:uncharacterized membrane protein
MSDKQLVIAFFENEDAADKAAEEIREWDKGRGDLEIDSIGILVKDDKGKIKKHKLGKRKTGTGVVLGAIAAILSGGLALIGGVVIGGLLGSLFHKGLGFSKDDLARIDSELDEGKAAVCIVTLYSEAATFSNKLAALGGEPEVHVVTEEALEHAHAAAEEDEAE